MPINFIDLKAQYRAMQADIDAAIHRVLDHGQYIMGPEVEQLERALARYTGAEHCITVASGTEALLIALMALGIGPGDEVVTTPFTFVATAEVIALVGATPVFVDIDPATCNMNPSLLDAAVSSKTRAIMPVSLYGQVPDMAAIQEVADRHQVPVIEDAAQSFGAEYQGRKSCNQSLVGCTSFFPSKPLGCYGDGGAIFTSSADLAKTMREIRVHGQERRYFHTRVGVGGRMDTLQCAVVLAKLSQFDHELELRAAAGQRYCKLLADIPGLQLPTVGAERNCVWGQFTIQLEERDRVAEGLKARGIPTAIHYPVPLHLQPAYADKARIAGALSNSEQVAGRVLSLPMHPYLEPEVQQTIAAALKELVA